MGQEFCASTPFYFFSDYSHSIGSRAAENRRQEFMDYIALRNLLPEQAVPDPQEETTFLRSKLDLRDREANAGIYRLYQTLLRLRRNDPVLATQDRHQLRAAVLGDQIIAMHRWHRGEHRLLIANLGGAADLEPSQLALADLPGDNWRLVLSTTQRRYGGTGDRVTGHTGASRVRLHLPPRSAALFAISGR